MINVIIEENDVVVEVLVTPEQEAFTYAAEAKLSRDEASQFATTAQEQAGQSAIYSAQAKDAKDAALDAVADSLLAKEASESAQAASELAQSSAEAYALSASSSASAANASKLAAKASRDTSEINAQTAYTKATEAAASAATATAMKQSAETAANTASQHESDAETAKDAAEAAVIAASAHKDLAKIYKEAADQYNTQAQAARDESVEAKDLAQAAKNAAQLSRDSAAQYSSNAGGFSVTAEEHKDAASLSAAAALVTKGQVDDLKADVVTLKSDTNTLKLAAETAENNASNSEAKAEKWADEAEDVEVTTGKYSAKHYSLKSEDYKDSAAASAASAATLANSIGLGGIFWPETEALRLRVIAEGGTFLRPMRLVDPEMDAYQGINTPLLTNMAAYKTGKLYSIRPDDASGDFTCTRATTSIRINQLGESETVPINTPVIDWTTGSPLLIVSTVGELTLTTPATATKVVITVDGVATEYNNIFPTLTLPIGSISTVIATVGGTEYDLLKAYLLRVSADSGIITEVGATITKDFFKNNEDTGITPTLALLAGSGQKVAKLHSQLPTDGSGDFTVARSTTKVITNKDGNLQTIAANVPPVTYDNGVPVIQPERQTTQLLTRPISFDNADWVKSGATVTSGFPAPAVDGSGNVLLDAYKLVATVNNGYIRLTTPQVITNASTYANSIWIKRVVGSGVVNLIGINGSDIPKTITTSWTKISDARAATSTSGQIGIKLATAGDEVMLYYGQMEAGDKSTSPVYIDKSLEGATRTRNADLVTNALTGHKSIVLNDKVKFYETGTESAYQIPIGSYPRLLTFDRIITVQEMIDLGVTEDTSTSMLLTSTGTGEGVSTLRLQVSSDMTVTLDGTGKFYTDAAGTLGESSSWTIAAGALRTIYIRVPSGSATLNIPNRKLITKIGAPGIDGWLSAANAPSLTITPASFINVTEIRIRDISTIYGALPTGLTYLRLEGNSINWTYSGTLPTGLTSLFLAGNNIKWTYSGALPTGLTYLFLEGNNIKWTYSGALPTGLGYLYLYGNSINWTYSGALPTGLTYLQLSGSNINWTGLNIGNNGNLSALALSNYRIAKMTNADFVTLLNQMASRTGSLPASASISDLANPTSTDGAVVAALANLQTVKGTTVVRGA